MLCKEATDSETNKYIRYSFLIYPGLRALLVKGAKGHLSHVQSAMVVAQLADQLLLTPEIRGSNPNIGNNLSDNCIM